MIQCVFLDIDGCLSSHIGEIFNLQLMQKLQEYNTRSQIEKTVPQITLNSGRPFSYCECVAQCLGTSSYYVFENGAGIGRNSNYKMDFILDEKITPELLKQVNQIIKRVHETYKEGPFIHQPNKDYAQTFLFEPNHPFGQELAQFIEDIIISKDLPLYVDLGYNFVNMNLKGLNKGTGLDLALKHSGLKQHQIAGVGDSKGDIDFVEKCAFKAAPANANDELKEICDYVSNYNDIEGIVDILHNLIQLNQGNK